MQFKRVFLPIIVILLLIIILPFIIAPLYNNWCLDKFAAQLFSQPLPEKTDLLDDIKQCGKLSGNGNGMDFLTVLIIRSDINLKELESFYNRISVSEAKPDSNPFSDPPFLKVYSLQSSKLDLNFINSPILIKDYSDFKNVYAVVLFDGGYNADYDIRGH
jgi:hypothetical protein